MSTPRSLFLSAAVLALTPGLLSAAGSDVEKVLTIKSNMVREFEVGPWHLGGTPGSYARFEKTNADPRKWAEGDWFTIHYLFSDSLKFKFHSEGGSGLYGFVLRKSGQEHPNIVFVYQPSGGWFVYSNVGDATKVKFQQIQFNKDQTELNIKGNFIE